MLSFPCGKWKESANFHGESSKLVHEADRRHGHKATLLRMVMGDGNRSIPEDPKQLVLSLVKIMSGHLFRVLSSGMKLKPERLQVYSQVQQLRMLDKSPTKTLGCCLNV